MKKPSGIERDSDNFSVVMSLAAKMLYLSAL